MYLSDWLGSLFIILLVVVLPTALLLFAIIYSAVRLALRDVRVVRKHGEQVPHTGL